MKILIFGDESMLLEATGQVLNLNIQDDVDVLSSTSIPSIGQFKKYRYDLLIVEGDFMDQNHQLALRQLVTWNPGMKIIALKTTGQTFSCPDDLRTVISTFLDKRKPFSALREFIDSIRTSTPITLQQTHQQPRPTLTPQEQRVFHLIGNGKTNHEIARILGISEHTVKIHRKRIAQKLDLRGAALIHRATLDAKAGFSETA